MVLEALIAEEKSQRRAAFKCTPNLRLRICQWVVACELGLAEAESESERSGAFFARFGAQEPAQR